jgi:hypothetical protein
MHAHNLQTYLNDMAAEIKEANNREFALEPMSF